MCYFKRSGNKFILRGVHRLFQTTIRVHNTHIRRLRTPDLPGKLGRVLSDRSDKPNSHWFKQNGIAHVM